MIQENAVLASAEVLNKNAVKFDSDRKWNNQKFWPYWYPLIPYPWQETDTLNKGQGLLGIEILPGQIKDISIITDRDTAYRLLNLKYTVYSANEATTGAGTLTMVSGSTAVVGVGSNFTTLFPDGIGWLTFIGGSTGLLRTVFVESVTDATNLVLSSPAPESAAGVAWGRGEWIWTIQTQAVPGVDIPNPIASPVPEEIQHFYDLAQQVKVGLRVPSLRDRDIYGGLERQLGLGGFFAENRHRITELQGAEDGVGMLRTALLVGGDSTITVRVENTNTDRIIFINGTTFGYKIALEGE